jgi:hypothetical protein
VARAAAPSRARRAKGRKAVRRRKASTVTARRKAVRRPARRRLKAARGRAGVAKRVSKPRRKTVVKRVASKIRKPRRTVGKVRAARKSRAAKKTFRRVPKAPIRAARVVRARRASVRRVALHKPAARQVPAIRPPIEAYRGSKPYIFTSYSHKNMREVFGVLKKLADSRYRIWYDEGVEPGNEWPEEVGRALMGSNLFMVFMSAAASNSRNVRNEINLASSENKNILVIFLQPAALSEGMKLQIGTVQYMNKHEMGEGEFIEKLKKTLSTELRG